MVLRRKIAAAAALLAACAAPARADVLADARAALKAGDAARAKVLYAQVPFGAAAWPAKLEDSVRFQLLSGNWLEAWRLTQVGRRVDLTLALPDLPYYEKLAALKAGSCAVTLEAAPRAWDLLLDAYAFRYSSRFRTAGYRGDPYRLAQLHQRQTHLAGTFVHFLDDIPPATLLAGMGCRFNHGAFKVPKEAQEKEKDVLADYVDLVESEQRTAPLLPGHDAVVLRLLMLAHQQKDPDIQKEVVKRYKNRDADGWLIIPEPERRFAWQKLIEAKAFPPPPLPPGHPLEKIVEAIVFNTKTLDVVPWLGAVDFDKWPLDTRRRLFDQLVAIENLPSRPRILLRQAQIAFDGGDLRGCLALVRRLTLESEGEGDDAAQDAAVRLATAIFREYQFDDSMLGAIQASLPASRWGQVYRAVLLDQALAGSVKGYDRLLDRIKLGKGAVARELDGPSLALLAPLARRELPKFSAALDAFQTKGRASAGIMRLLTQIAERAAGLSGETLGTLRPYFARLSAFLVGQLQRGQNQQQLLELLHVYDPDAQGAWQKGSATVREGVTQIGVVALDFGELQANPYRWEAPASLPLRDLVVIPHGVGDRAWLIR